MEPPKVEAPVAAPAVPAEPQATTAAFGDWILRCAAGAPGAKPVCEVAQTLRLQGQGPIAEIAFGRAPVNGQPQGPLKIVVLVPANVTIANPVKLAVDEADAGVDLAYRRCLPQGCFADADATDAVLKRWREQTERGRLAFRDATNRDIAFPFSFRGLAQALDALSKK